MKLKEDVLLYNDRGRLGLMSDELNPLAVAVGATAFFWRPPAYGDCGG